jgi:hypothetical protein
MRTGGIIAVVLILLAELVHLVFDGRDGQYWQKLAAILITAIVTFCVPPLWNWFIRRRRK